MIVYDKSKPCSNLEPAQSTIVIVTLSVFRADLTLPNESNDSKISVCVPIDAVSVLINTVLSDELC